MPDVEYNYVAQEQIQSWNGKIKIVRGEHLRVICARSYGRDTQISVEGKIMKSSFDISVEIFRLFAYNARTHPLM